MPLERLINGILMKQINRFWYGAIVGLLAPQLVLVGIYYTDYVQVSFLQFYKNIIESETLSVLLQPAMLINLGIFLFFVNRNQLKFCRGVILSTIIYGLYIAFTFIS